ncbi:MAG: SUMF1/EgtB/PvdO family nonheme iron enzyme [Candidatus Thiodiazotropha taylori]
MSYSRNDLEAASALRVELQRAGLTVFKDDDSIRSGDRWITRLDEALRGCSAFVVLVGHEGVRGWVGAEVEVALIRQLSSRDEKSRLPIFPILLDEAQIESLPVFLARIQVEHWSPSHALPDGLVAAIKERAVRRLKPKIIEGCPFLGLDAFRRKDAHLFFGRRMETLEALACLGNQQEINPDQLQTQQSGHYRRWLQIEGNSGAGKSSLVQAAMLPMIEQGALWARTGFTHWRILGPMMPGKVPLTKLAEVVERGLVSDPGQRDSLRRLERLQQDERALALALRDQRQAQGAYLLIVDQFEEFFTFADEAPRKHFDTLLANALDDPECPLFMISTVRADFLDRYEQLPALQAIYNSHCARYFLPIITEQGLREAIEEPAALAGLDVSEITTAIFKETEAELGALPLVENALTVLWKQRKHNNRLSGDQYTTAGGLVGILSSQADALLDRIGRDVTKGRQAALELLLSLTRINDEGRHTRQRLTREEAVLVAGVGKREIGERVVQLLSGERPDNAPSEAANGALRLITISTEETAGRKTHSVDLIHETLIRPRKQDEQSGKRIGYWPTLYDYIEKNRDRSLHRQQLRLQARRWANRGPLGRWWHLAGWGDLSRYRNLRLNRRGEEGRFLTWSRRWKGVQALLLLLALGLFGHSAWWANSYNLDPSYIVYQVLWRLDFMGLFTPLPEMVQIEPGHFTMGCLPGRDDVTGSACGEGEAKYVEISHPFEMGIYEVSFLEYDYYIWDQRRQGLTKPLIRDQQGRVFTELMWGSRLDYPPDENWGRVDQPVINVDWYQALAYAQWLGDRTERSCRLPTEVEWEYAARADTQKAYALPKESGGSETIADKGLANCRGCGSKWDGEQTLPVKSFSANAWGLHNMHGNVEEWCLNEHDYHDDTAIYERKVARVLRGGSWGRPQEESRAAYRRRDYSTFRFSYRGFRVVCVSPLSAERWLTDH